MESLYRKYRPQTFADVVGQQHVVGTLEHAVLEGRTSHAYLFCGPRGTGKTTMARLVAKALMCEQGPGQLPDGTCEQCRLIAAGEHPDVYELDAASRTGVDNVREEIINRVSYAPVRGRYKVYIIDEVHMLTTQAFNALLKTLEEPPGHVVFILCTTDPQKIPATILSRVQRFDFRPIGNEDIQGRLAYVCEQEGFTYEDAALELIVRHARGGMRDALSTLEQLSVFGDGVIGVDAARDLLGAVPGSALGEVVRAMAARDVAALFAQVGSLVDAGRDLLQVTRELAAHMRDVYVVAAVGANPAVLPAGSDTDRLRAEAAAFGSVDRLARILTLLGDVSREMSTAPNQRLVLEIAFTRIARPEADLTLESLAERVAELERGAVHPVAAATLVAPITPAPVAAASVPALESTSEPVTRPAPVEKPLAAPAPQPQQPQPRPEPQPAPAPEPAPVPAPRSQRPTPEPPKQAATQQRARKTSARDAAALQRQWRQVVSELVARVPARGSLLSSAVATSDDGQELVVGLPQGSTFALKMLERPDIRTVVEGVVAEVFGQRTLRFKEGIGSDLRVPPAATRASQAVGATRPAAAPAPAPASVVAPAAAPAPVAAPAPAPITTEAPAYPMPWDEPASQVPSAVQPVEAAPYDDVVPYDEIYAGAYDDVPYEDEPAVVETPEPMPDRQPQPEPNPRPQSQPQPQPQPEPADPEPAKPQVAPVNEVPTDLPPDLAAILENAFEVFGDDVKSSVSRSAAK
ncbi:MAG: DNA polymerase III subunit gamma/tau [Atopobiaceae bacterium]|nr:DNA polymerase III subunit gamma/tau [Atopobiaceae bacterium]